MTHVYFVRHAEPNYNNHDDLTRELTEKGLRDRELVTAFLADKQINAVLSSPYKRAADTVRHFADEYGHSVTTIPDFRERKIDSGWIEDFDDFTRRQWADFNYKRSDGENLSEVQKRNINALQKVLVEHDGKAVVIGSHGTALSTIVNYYQPKFDYTEFVRIKSMMPWVVHFVFSGSECVQIEEFDLFTGTAQCWLQKKGTERKYYEAYDDRYRQVHRENLQWFTGTHSPILEQVVSKYSIQPTQRCLEIGCGEGRDANFLMSHGYDLLATDVSPEAIAFCREKFFDYRQRFCVLDCVTGRLSEQFDFIYAVAVVHMLVPDEDRTRFYGFVCEHLSDTGLALICTMGDGTYERQSDIATAFQLQSRVHEPTGTMLNLAGTSCRMVSFQTFDEELQRSGLVVVEQGMTAIEPDFTQMMYAVVKRASGKEG